MSTIMTESLGLISPGLSERLIVCIWSSFTPLLPEQLLFVSGMSPPPLLTRLGSLLLLYLLQAAQERVDLQLDLSQLPLDCLELIRLHCTCRGNTSGTKKKKHIRNLGLSLRVHFHGHRFNPGFPNSTHTQSASTGVFSFFLSSLLFTFENPAVHPNNKQSTSEYYFWHSPHGADCSMKQAIFD